MPFVLKMVNFVIISHVGHMNFCIYYYMQEACQWTSWHFSSFKPFRILEYINKWVVLKWTIFLLNPFSKLHYYSHLQLLPPNLIAHFHYLSLYCYSCSYFILKSKYFLIQYGNIPDLLVELCTLGSSVLL